MRVPILTYSNDKVTQFLLNKMAKKWSLKIQTSAKFEPVEQNRSFSNMFALKCMGFIGANDLGRGPPIIATPLSQKWSITTIE